MNERPRDETGKWLATNKDKRVNIPQTIPASNAALRAVLAARGNEAFIVNRTDNEGSVSSVTEVRDLTDAVNDLNELLRISMYGATTLKENEDA